MKTEFVVVDSFERGWLTVFSCAVLKSYFWTVTRPTKGQIRRMRKEFYTQM